MTLSSSLKARILTAVIAIPVALFILYLGRPIVDALFILFALLMMREWDTIVSAGSLGQIEKADAVGLTVVGVSLICASHDVISAALWIMFLGAAAVFILRKTQRAWHAIGVIYIGLAVIASFVLIDYAGIVGLLWLLITVWALDIFAFVFGKNIGGPKIATTISPNKTWAGLAGAIIGAMLSCWAFDYFGLYPFEFSPMLFGALIAIVAQSGDFWESYVKRRFGVKDSSDILPGHGGILDRMDGFMAAAVLVAIMFWAT